MFDDVVRTRDSYIALFVLLLLDFLILNLDNSPRWSGLVRSVSVSVTVLFAIHTSKGRITLLRFAQFGVVLSVVTGIVQTVTDNPRATGVAFCVTTVLLAVTPVAILRRLFQHERVDVETVFGAIDVYIVFGLLFASLFAGIAKIHPNPAFFAQVRHPMGSTFVYMSFVTLTTVGFGDITPFSNLARSVVVLEAMVGQVFLVTLVARLVSLYGLEQPSARRQADLRDENPNGDIAALEPSLRPERPTPETSAPSDAGSRRARHFDPW